MDLKEERAIGGDPLDHWYYIAKSRAIKSLLGGTRAGMLLDVGAGSGVFSRALLAGGLAEKAVCVDPNYDDDWLATRQAPGLAYTREADAAEADLVLMIDVIEHVDDDRGLIASYARSARAGTKFLISVPAFDFLWSSHDDFLEHRRRYTLARLRAAVEGAGLAPRDLRYFFGALFPAVAAARFADRAFRGDAPARSALKPSPRWLNRLLVAVHDVERATLFPVNRVAGVSAFCLAEKPALAPAAAAA